MSIKTKLYTIIFITAITGALSISAFYYILSIQQKVYTKNELEQTLQMNLIYFIKNEPYILKAQNSKFVENFSKNIDSIHSNLNKLKAFTIANINIKNDNENEIINKIRIIHHNLKVYKTNIGNFILLNKRKVVSNKIQIENEYKNNISNAFTNIELQMQEVMNLLNKELKHKQNLPSITLFMIAILAISFLLTLIFTYAIVINITKPLSYLISVAHKITNGDFIPIVKRNRKDELGRLLNAMIELQESIIKIKEKSHTDIKQLHHLEASIDALNQNIIIANQDHEVIYLNKATKQLFAKNESYIKKQLPNFKLNEIIGSGIFSAVLDLKSILTQIDKPATGKFYFGESTLKLAATPVYNIYKERTGTIIELYSM